MYGFEIKGTVKKTDIPGARGVRRNYSKLIKSVATLKAGEALEVAVDKRSVAEGIRMCIKKHFKHTKFTISTRRKGTKITTYIIRED